MDLRHDRGWPHLALGLFFLGRRTATTKQNPATAISQKSVAVLPFENLSDDKANAYFSDGIQEEILTRLAKIADLKVISRTSTQQYQSKPGNLSEIAKQLGVANILEGSVQKAGDQVRVNVQLINAQADSHVWADTYDRKLTDIFGVESEIAKSIAQSLQAKLTGREEQALATKPTNNPEAYEAYLRGLAYALKAGNTPGNSLGAQKYLREAVRLDPKFALRLGAAVIRGCGWLHHINSSTDDGPPRRGAAGSRNRAHSSAQSRRGAACQGPLPLRLPDGLRILRGVTLYQSASASTE